MDTPKPKLVTVLKWVGGFISCVAIAPFVLLALKGILGAAAFLVAGAVGIALLKLQPWFSMKLANLVLKLVKHEANKNPIETMQNLMAEKTVELEKADAAIVDFEAEVLNYDGKTKEFTAEYPEEAGEFQNISERMHQLLDAQKREQNEARAVLSDLKQRIAKAEAIWEMALAAEHVTDLSKSAQQQVFAEIREKVAFDAVTRKLNQQFASLNMAVSKRAEVRKPAAIREGTNPELVELLNKTPDRNLGAK